jgi:hypothetical protein
MPDMLGYWDRRTDDPNYSHTDFLGNAVYLRKKLKLYLKEK